MLPAEKAEPSNADTWRAFEIALRAYKDNREWDGISFALDRRWGIVGIDLDHVSEHARDAQRIVSDLASYTETTPSGGGLASSSWASYQTADAGESGWRCTTSGAF